MAKAMHYSGFLFDRYALDNHFIFAFRTRPVLEPTPIKLGDGSVMNPGDQFSEIKGKKRSAGFSCVFMLDGSVLEYVGTFTDISGTAVCFDTITDDKRERIAIEGYEAAYHGWLMMEGETCWFHSTPAVAGRITETTDVVRRDHE